jgi:hypothetical protein
MRIGYFTKKLLRGSVCFGPTVDGVTFSLNHNPVAEEFL